MGERVSRRAGGAIDSRCSVEDQKRYYSFARFLLQRYGERVSKISVDAGWTCPNRDGRCGVEGCLFCRVDSFSRMESLQQIPVAQQVESGVQRGRQKGVNKFIVYFQASTNTYAPVTALRSVFLQAASFPDVVGVSIATRPDCLGEELMPLLTELAERVDVWIEVGLQSVHDRTLQLVRRGHTYADFEQAVQRLSHLPVRVCVHLMLGLPGEDHAMMMETAERLAQLPVHELKLHPMLVLKDTAAERLYRQSAYRALELDEYVELLIDFLQRTPADRVLQRVTAEAPAELLIAPLWPLHKARVHSALQREMERRNARQGRLCV